MTNDGPDIMKKDYGIVSISEYLKLVKDVKCLSISDSEVNMKLGRYLLNLRRYETNAKILESLIL